MGVRKAALDQIEALFKIGSPLGRAQVYHDAQMNHASAQADLYRTIGDHDKLVESLKRKLESARQKHQSLEVAYRSGTTQRADVVVAELDLAEAEYELKQAQKSPEAPLSPWLSMTKEASVYTMKATDVVPSPKPLPKKQDLTFQGKTFDQWVEELKTELDPKTRAEAIRAMAAFGANGRGKEATAVIVHAVGNLHFSINDGPRDDKSAAILAFVQESDRIPLEDSFPLLLKNFTEGTRNEKSFVNWVLQRLNATAGKMAPVMFETLENWDFDKGAPEHAISLFHACFLNDPPPKKLTLAFIQKAVKEKNERKFQLAFFRESRPNYTTQSILWRRDYYETFGKFFLDGLLKLLKEEGMKSENETIRKTSTKVLETLQAVDKKE